MAHELFRTGSVIFRNTKYFHADGKILIPVIDHLYLSQKTNWKASLYFEMDLILAEKVR